MCNYFLHTNIEGDCNHDMEFLDCLLHENWMIDKEKLGLYFIFKLGLANFCIALNRINKHTDILIEEENFFYSQIRNNFFNSQNTLID